MTETAVEFGLELTVGERPKPVSYGTFKNFNKLFLELFEYFMEHEQLRYVQFQAWDSPLSSFGYLEISQARRWLKYYQLITVEHIKEPLEEPYGPFKNRTVWILKPTKIGFFAYEHGKVIGLDVYDDTYRVGIGKPYTTYDELYGLAMAIWEYHRIAKTLREKWGYEVREMYEKLLDKTGVEAKEAVREWATQKAFEWNRKHPRKFRFQRKIKNPIINPMTGEIVLEKGQKTIFDFSKK